jgi:hypothetical protein
MRKGIRSTAVSALALAGLCLSAAAARAQDVTVFGSESDYAAAVGDQVFCLDFDGSTGALVDGSSFSSDVTFSSPEATDPTQVNWSSDAISDAGSTTAPNGVGPVGGAFATAAAAFKLTFSSAGTAETVELYDASDNLVASVTAPNASGFFGVVSSTPIQRFVILPGIFDESTGDRDRFFVDDFCVNEAAPPPPTLDEMCAALLAAVEGADPASFQNAGKQGALVHKLENVCAKIAKGNLRGTCQAIQKLTHDVLPKTDGEGAPGDWVTDATLQQSLEDGIQELLAALQAEADALGGCRHGNGGTGPGSGGGNGNGHGHGNGNGHSGDHGNGHGNH